MPKQATVTKPDNLAPPSRLNLLREMVAGFDALGMPGALLRAARTPQTFAKKATVMVLPGFTANDASTAPLRYFISKNGYAVEGWGMGFNTAGRGLATSTDELPDHWEIEDDRTRAIEAELPALIDKVIAHVAARAEQSGQKIALVGWSLGGYIAREVARQLPEHVSCIVTLGSPVIGGPKYSATADLFKARGADLDWIEEQTLKREENPIQQPVTVIYSKSDGIVAWQASLDKFSPNATNIEVGVSHMGMGFNAEVWGHVLKALDAHTQQK